MVDTMQCLIGERLCVDDISGQFWRDRFGHLHLFKENHENIDEASICRYG